MNMKTIKVRVDNQLAGRRVMIESETLVTTEENKHEGQTSVSPTHEKHTRKRKGLG